MSEYDQQYTRYQINRSWPRKLLRKIYLASAVSQLNGATVDLGCGIGDLLTCLPAGSIGLDVNPTSIAYCRDRGLNACVYDGELDHWSLSALKRSDGLQSLVVSHVLEHLDHPMEKLSRILRSCDGIGIRTVLVVVPGRRGFASDQTHRTFIDKQMLSDASVTAGSTFRLTHTRHFPVNMQFLGTSFTHLELQARFLGASEIS